MNNSGASSSDPKGKRPLSLDELESLDKENNRAKRIKLEAELRDIPYEDCKLIMDIEESDLVEKQAKQETEDEMLAKVLSDIFEEEQSNIVNRQIKDDEAIAKFVAQQENVEPTQRERSIFAMSSEEEEEGLSDATGGSNVPESSFDESSN